jgi:hypothetical protein
MEPLTYDSRDMRYHGVQSDGTPIQIDGEALQEAIEQRLIDNHAMSRTGDDWDRARGDAVDPDGWSEDMAGWIPAGE